MNFDIYTKLKRSEYADLAKTIGDILRASIEDHPDGKKMCLQQIQHRAKDPDSLKKKLEVQNLLDTTTLETEIKDLAGARLIFYTNSDVNRFLSSGIVRDNFEINWERTKNHYPSPEKQEAGSQFISINYVLKLKEERTSLSEYARFQGMWCEVQVQTILNHAWSEMAHDIIYKKSELKGFGSQLFDGIQKKLDTIQRKFLLPAGHEFQKVLEDYERLLNGKDLWNRGALDGLSSCNDNDSRYDLLQRYVDYVLPCLDDPKNEYPEIRQKVILCVKEARLTPTRPVETPFGTYHGSTEQDILGIAVDIFQRLRYIDIEGTFDAICELYSSATSDKERERLLELAKNLSEHNLTVWKEAGSYVQKVLVKRIQDLDITLYNGPLRPVILKVLSEALKPEFHGTSTTYKSITFQRGPVVPSEVLTRLRHDALEILKNIYLASETDAQKREVINSFSEASSTPYSGKYPDELLCTILENSQEITNFFTEHSAEQSFEILQKLEYQFLWMYRGNQHCPEELLKNSTVKKACESLHSSIVSFRDKINQNRNFVIYKTLVGYQSIFLPAWENDSFGLNEEKQYKEAAVDGFVSEINEENAEEWYSVIQRCAQTKSDDLATFPSFVSFLEKLGHLKPLVMLGYIDRLDERLSGFLPAILCGLSKSVEKDSVKKRIYDWVSKGIFLGQISQYLKFSEEYDPALLKKILLIGVEKNDANLVLNVLTTVVHRYERSPNKLLNEIFMSAICFLTVKEDVRWVNAVWFMDKIKELLAEISAGQVDTLLNNLVHCQQLEHHTEHVLTVIADRFPEKVFDFLGTRLKHKAKEGIEKYYDAIPFKFQGLEEPLAKIPKYAIRALRDWFLEEDYSFQFQAGRLPSIIFPGFPNELNQELLSMVRSGDRSSIRFVLKILMNYTAQSSLQEICKEIIKILPSDDELLSELEIVLQTTGVIRGEFGSVEILNRKKDDMESWLQDSDEKVKEFARKFILSLMRQIKADQRRIEEEVELRKHRFTDDG